MPVANRASGATRAAEHCSEPSAPASSVKILHDRSAVSASASELGLPSGLRTRLGITMLVRLVNKKDRAPASESDRSRGTAREPLPLPYRSPASTAARQNEYAGRSGRNASRPLHSRPGNVDIAYTARSTQFLRFLTQGRLLCYGAPLSPGIDPQTNPSTLVSLFGTIFSNVCHELCCLGLVLLVLSAPQLKAQTFRPALPTPDQPDQPSTNPNQHLKIAREHGPSPGEKYIEAVDQ